MNVEILRVPFDGAEEILDNLANIFGEQERELESPQLLGKELEHNTDIVVRVTDDGKIVGSVHATIPRCNPEIAGLSAMFTSPEVRGKGIGKLVFGTMISELEKRQVKTMFLGTEAPVAEKLYASFGFRYLYGSGVMIRTRSGGPIDFYRERFSKTVKEFTVSQMNADMRIPIIPLALTRLDYKVYDANIGLANPYFITQRSCMGLYQKYLSCFSRGGKAFVSVDESGILGAVATLMPDEDGNFRFDAFSHPSFSPSVSQLFEYALSHFDSTDTTPVSKNKVYIDVAKTDLEKIRALTELGMKISSSIDLHIGEFSIAGYRYVF